METTFLVLLNYSNEIGDLGVIIKDLQKGEVYKFVPICGVDFTMEEFRLFLGMTREIDYQYLNMWMREHVVDKLPPLQRFELSKKSFGGGEILIEDNVLIFRGNKNVNKYDIKFMEKIDKKYLCEVFGVGGVKFE